MDKIKHPVTLILFIPIALILLIAAYSSSQTYEQQTLIPVMKSLSAPDWLRTAMDQVSFTYAGSIVSTQSLGYAGFTEFFLRKGAHVIIFFSISFFLFRLLIHLIPSVKKAALLNLALVILFAFSDEFHQYLTGGGRTPTFQDIILDTTGGILGLTVAYGVFVRYKKQRKNRGRS
ncbi:VanZ family protein [Jeotgalibacillus sp. JSM ZJ347]|uniref:VanZ family protein n=1 Tax=Jeotgalibacillus sp. JSM ZJ347 TaxID=3342117 RepID=UPI0035A8BAA8